MQQSNKQKNLTPTPLDVFTLPLTGARLIEASAGTGKTYTLAGLYLRLLLGLGQEGDFPERLNVEEILVVTFTEAATQELRSRIRANIRSLRLACHTGQSHDPLLQGLLERISDPELAARLLLMAERQMDQASIFTIHGFCQRMLSQHTLASGRLFDMQLITDEQALAYQATADFWRLFCYDQPIDVVGVIQAIWATPQQLLFDLAPYLQGEFPQFDQQSLTKEEILLLHQQWIGEIDRIKQRWRELSDELVELIAKSDINKRSYSKSNLPRWAEKVSQWAQHNTVNYQLIDELERFSQSAIDEKTPEGQVAKHVFFDEVDTLLSVNRDLRQYILPLALVFVREKMEQEKRRHAVWGYGDLLRYLDEALSGENAEVLAQTIRKLFPVAMIDEFQDTDPQQYRIFNRIYHQQPSCGLLLIGDPKQAIYSFRGADIFTYIYAKQHVNAHYTLDVNWRSSELMVEAVNYLFSNHAQAFVFEQIPFTSVNAAPKNSQRQFSLDQQVCAPLTLALLTAERISQTQFQQEMAQACANEIAQLLEKGQAQQALLCHGEKTQPLKAADITVIVRRRSEADIIKLALQERGIPSVYLSDRESVFSTQEALDLLWFLEAILMPQNERLLRTALSTTLFNYSAAELECIIHDEIAWDNIVEEFLGYQQCWLQFGILPMLREFMSKRHIAEQILAAASGERRLTDLLHLGELLQDVATSLEGGHALVRWLNQQILHPDHQEEKQQLRLENDEHVVKIITIHKSKGLEYPVVFLPFGAFYKPANQLRYHDRTDFSLRLALTEEETIRQWVEEERLAEDLRLLYVALTRAIYFCWVGIAPISASAKKAPTTLLHETALGYLLQQGQALDESAFISLLSLIDHQSIAVKRVALQEKQQWQADKAKEVDLSVREFITKNMTPWRVTSYSGLQQQGHSSSHYEVLPRFDDEVLTQPQNTMIYMEHPELSIHNFPKGAAAGTFLHALFEEVDFNQLISQEQLQPLLQRYGIEDKWLAPLHEWINDVVNVPLDESGLTLNALMPSQRQAELAFYLPISCPLHAKALNELIQHYDGLSQHCPPLDFQTVEGMLKGFIDLVFCWQGRYYVLDYKSNWLGETSESYHQDAIKTAMQEHRYDLQYQLYTLALHRFLRHRLPNYSYDQHFGGVFYLFLRGMDAEQVGQGVFFNHLDIGLVNGLDGLFSGEPRQ